MYQYKCNAHLPSNEYPSLQCWGCGHPTYRTFTCTFSCTYRGYDSTCIIPCATLIMSSYFFTSFLPAYFLSPSLPPSFSPSLPLSLPPSLPPPGEITTALLQTELSEIADKWYEFGVKFLDANTLHQIEAEKGKSQKDYFNELLSHLVDHRSSNDMLSWGRVVEVVREVGSQELADRLAEKYGEGEGDEGEREVEEEGREGGRKELSEGWSKMEGRGGERENEREEGGRVVWVSEGSVYVLHPTQE